MSKIPPPYKRQFPVNNLGYPNLPLPGQIPNMPLPTPIPNLGYLGTPFLGQIPNFGYSNTHNIQFQYGNQIPNVTRSLPRPLQKESVEIECIRCSEPFSHIIGYPLTLYTLKRNICIRCLYLREYDIANNIGVTAGYNVGFQIGQKKIIWDGIYDSEISNNLLKNLWRKLIHPSIEDQNTSEDIKLATKEGFKSGARFGYRNATYYAYSVYKSGHKLAYEYDNGFNFAPDLELPDDLSLLWRFSIKERLDKLVNTLETDSDL